MLLFWWKPCDFISIGFCLIVFLALCNLSHIHRRWNLSIINGGFGVLADFILNTASMSCDGVAKFWTEGSDDLWQVLVWWWQGYWLSTEITCSSHSPDSQFCSQILPSPPFWNWALDCWRISTVRSSCLTRPWSSSAPLLTKSNALTTWFCCLSIASIRLEVFRISVIGWWYRESVDFLFSSSFWSISWNLVL